MSTHHTGPAWESPQAGIWYLKDEGRLLATMRKQDGRWSWSITDGPSGIAGSMDAANGAVGRALQKLRGADSPG